MIVFSQKKLIVICLGMLCYHSWGEEIMSVINFISLCVSSPMIKVDVDTLTLLHALEVKDFVIVMF